MTLPKILLIGGVTITVIAAGIGVYLTRDNPQAPSSPEESLVSNYKDLLEEMKDSKTKNSLSANCNNSQNFSKQIQDLETKLDLLKQQKNNLINPTRESSADTEEWIPPIPGSEPLDFDEPTPEEAEEWIPPIPGSEPLDFDKPTPGEEEEWIPPIPGSEPLDFDEPTPEEAEEWIPKPGAQPLEIDPGSRNNAIDEINALEKEIIVELNNLKSLCDQEEKKEIISTSCVEACKKYYDCAGYTEGSTKEDQKDAYDSCMIECAKWSDKTKICINKIPIKTVTDCTNFSICALAEYGNGAEK